MGALLKRCLRATLVLLVAGGGIVCMSTAMPVCQSVDVSQVAAVSPDSVVLASASWQTDTLDGMLLRRVRFSGHEYFGSNQYIAVLEVSPDAGLAMALAWEPVRTRTSVMAIKHGALAAVNGSFFDMKKHNPICHLRIGGEEIAVNEPGKDTVNRKYYQYGTIVLDSGKVCILHTDSARLWERTLSAPDIMTAGPLLICQGKRLPMRNDLSFVSKRHNRTALGIKADGTLLLLTADGRTREAEGLSLDELTLTLQWLGCRDAINLDGGGSTTMYVKDFPHGGVVNHPSDNGRFDHQGERGVSNILMIKKKD